MSNDSATVKVRDLTPLKVRIVVAKQNAAWVIGKMGHRLCEGLVALGCDAMVADSPDPTADVNQWMSYAFADGCPGTLNTMMVTHVDDPYKISLIRTRVEKDIQLALCMSPHMREELAGYGVPAERMWWVLPAVDSAVPLRRLTMGITGRVYDDGRKREKFLSRLAQEMDLSLFRFEFFGTGWEKTSEDLVKGGAEVMLDPGTEDWQGDYVRMREAISKFDYYVCLGMDEGSLGTLDAVTAGVKTITTPQGFHLNIPGGITHSFVTYEQFREIFVALVQDRRSGSEGLADWTWKTYAEEHLAIWNAMKRHQGAPVPQEELASVDVRKVQIVFDPSKAGHIASKGLKFYCRLLNPARARGAFARIPALQPLRRFLNR